MLTELQVPWLHNSYKATDTALPPLLSLFASWCLSGPDERCDSFITVRGFADRQTAYPVTREVWERPELWLNDRRSAGPQGHSVELLSNRRVVPPPKNSPPANNVVSNSVLVECVAGLKMLYRTVRSFQASGRRVTFRCLLLSL